MYVFTPSNSHTSHRCLPPRVFIAACVDSVFVRNCTGCVFTVACKQLRTRDCKDCEFRLYCKTEPIIETSHGMTFAPFNGAYVGHAEVREREDHSNRWGFPAARSMETGGGLLGH